MSYKDVMKRQRKARKKRERQRAKPRPLVLRPQPCGGCTACCTCVAVQELRKGFYSPCPFCDGTGCVTYKNRPPSCAGYLCAYATGLIPERPDQCGILFSPEWKEGKPILVVYEVRPDVLMDSLAFVFEVAETLTRKGVVLHRLELHRYGADLPNEWDGHNYRTKAMGWGDPNKARQVWFTVRTGHEAEDGEWWKRAMDKVVKGGRR